MTPVRVLRRRAVVATLVLGALAVSGPASARPDVTDDDVRAAKSAVAEASLSVAALEVQLATRTAALDGAWTAVATAAEDYTQALGERDAAVQTARGAADRGLAARQEVEDARQELGEIALQAYRSGGSLDGLGALLSADGFEDLIDRTSAMDRLGDRADQVLQRFRAADLVARTLDQRAADAAADAEAATAAAAAALEEAESLQQAAEDQVTEVAEQREELLLQLSALRETSVEVERARQDAVDAERARRVEAAAAAERGVKAAPGGAVPGPGPGSQPAPAAPTPSGQPPVVPQPPTGAPPVAPAPPLVQPPPPATPTTPAPPVVQPPTNPVPPPAPAPGDFGLGTGSQRGSAAQGQAAVDWALQQVGKDYEFGTAGAETFDCSGLTSEAWRAAGLSIHRTSRDQYRQVQKITYDSMRPGDLIFYGSVGSDPGSISHVAMYVGPGQMVEAPRPDVPVRVTPIRWSGTMPYAGRP